MPPHPSSPAESTAPTPRAAGIAQRPAFLQVRGLHHAFDAGRGAARLPPLFTDLSFSLPAGVSLLDGDMGCGKSTLLRLIAGELPLQRGEIHLASRPPHRRPLGADAAADRRDICCFDPRDEAFDPLTAADLYAALRKRHPGPAGLAGAALADWQAEGDAEWQAHIEGFGLVPHRDKPLFTLSTGSRRKAGLAAALACRCPLTLLDDATAGLDRPALDWLAEVLEDLAAEAELAEKAATAAPDAHARLVLLVSDPALEGLAGVHTLRLP